jgi:hypothetical protein
MTNLICQPKCLRQWKMAAMKNRVGRCRLVVLATGASTGKRLLAFTKIRIAAFPANIAPAPLFRSDKFQAKLLALRKFFELYRGDLVYK